MKFRMYTLLYYSTTDSIRQRGFIRTEIQHLHAEADVADTTYEGDIVWQCINMLHKRKLAHAI